MIKLFSLYRGRMFLKRFQYCKLLGYLSCHISDLFIEVQLVVNIDTKESEVFTNWYCCIIAVSQCRSGTFVSEFVSCP